MIANHKGEIPVVILLVPYLLGIILGVNIAFVHIVSLTILLVFLIITFILLNLAYQRLGIYKIRWLGGVFISIILFLFGWISAINYNGLNNDHHFSKSPAQYLVVKINNEPIFKNGLLRFTTKVEANLNNGIKTISNGTLLITLKDSLAKDIYYGDELLIPANYAPVDPPFNPAEFNYKRYLANQNIYHESFLYHGQYVILAHNTGNPLIAFSLRLRQKLVEKFKSNVHNPEAIAVASTLILGYKADMSSDVLQAYANTGTTYVLTVSGAQVAIIYFLLSLSLGFLNRFKYGKLIKAILIITLIWYYAILCGFSPAVCRVALMLSMVIIGKTYDRYINTLNLLAASAFLLLLYDPFLVTDVGFQLSYIAISGLIIFRPIVYNWVTFKNKWADKIWGLCSVSIAAQVIIFPLSAFYFHQFPVYFLVSNMFIFIPATIITYVGMLYLLLPQIPFVSKWLGIALEKSILLMDKALAVIEHAPFASINKIWINPIEYLLLYAIIVSLFCFFYYRRAWLIKMSLCCMLLLSVSISLKKINAMRSDNLVFLNLHKHIGLVMKTGNRAIVISDLSDTDKNYKYSIQPYLDSSKISDVSLYNPKQDINSPFLLKKYNLIQFLDKRILVYDKYLSSAQFDGKLNIDYLYLTGNPHTDLNSINKNYAYRMLVIDATNTDNFIKNLQDEAKTMPVNYTVLKRNKSLLIVSN